MRIGGGAAAFKFKDFKQIGIYVPLGELGRTSPINFSSLQACRDCLEVSNMYL